MIDRWLRLPWAVACLLPALLAVVRAPTYLLWQAAVLATEMGWIVALATLPVLLPGWRRTRAGIAAAAIAMLTIVLALSPWVRAVAAARDARQQLASVTGDVAGSPFSVLRIVPSSAADARMTTHAYAQRDGTSLLLDLYQPATTAAVPRPLVVVIHGGSWRAGDRTQLAPLNHHLAARGSVVAAIQYRLAPAHVFPAALEDVTAAVSWLKANAPSFGIDRTRITLLGRSAGGQLALLAAYTLGPGEVRAAVSFYGPTDLVWGWENPGNPRVIDSRAVLRDYIGGTLPQRRDDFVRASPVRHAATAVPTLLLHGGRDELVSERHAQRLGAALAQHDVPHAYVRMPWATHGCDYVFRGPCGQISTWAVDRFLAGLESQRPGP